MTSQIFCCKEGSVSLSCIDANGHAMSTKIAWIQRFRLTALADLRTCSRGVCECWRLSKPIFHPVHNGPQDWRPPESPLGVQSSPDFNYPQLTALRTWHCRFSDCQLKKHNIQPHHDTQICIGYRDISSLYSLLVLRPLRLDVMIQYIRPEGGHFDSAIHSEMSQITNLLEEMPLCLMPWCFSPLPYLLISYTGTF